MVESNAYIFAVDTSEKLNWSQMWLRDQKIPSKILNSSFVIERLAGRKTKECFSDQLAGLNPWVCNGDLVLKELNGSH